MARITNQNYHFTDSNNAAPTISSITSFSSHPLYEYKINRYCCAVWALDYTWQKCFDIRVGNTKKPWKSRQKQMAYLYPPNTVFWEDYRNAKPGISGISILFTKGQAANLDKLISKKAGYARFDDSDHILGKILYDIPALLQEQGLDSFYTIQSYLWNIFNILHKSRHVKNEDYLILNKQSFIEESITDKVENYMREHYSEKLSLDDISSHFGLSPITLNRRFKKDNKISPMARLKEIRIEIAKTMLLKGEKLFVIAQKIGFSDEYHLSKIFKKITTQSPREFVKSLQN